MYKTVDNTYVDLDHYRVLRNAPPLSEGLERVDDDDKGKIQTSICLWIKVLRTTN